jgi:thioredoxin-related protein
MRVRAFWLILPCCLLLLCQCGLVHNAARIATKKKANPAQTALDPQRRGWALMMSDEEWARYKAGAATGDPAAPTTAPGATEAGLFDFSSMVSGQSRAPTTSLWQRSATVATKHARVTGTPLLIYATHRSSIRSQEMESTLMNSPAFQSMIQEKFVPLLVDYSDQETSRSPMYRELKSRFQVRGYPALVVAMPDGTEVAQFTGYKSDQQHRYLESLKNASIQAERQINERRAKLEKEGGYRMWKNKDGKPVFARLTELDANMGTFTGEWGESFKTFLTRLSDEDQAWIAERRKE